jgi:hypothetical protein
LVIFPNDDVDLKRAVDAVLANHRIQNPIFVEDLSVHLKPQSLERRRDHSSVEGAAPVFHAPGSVERKLDLYFLVPIRSSYV